MSDAHNEHESVIRTPKQLAAAVIGFFAVVVIGIMLLVSYVTTPKLTGAGTESQSAEAIEARVRPVADEGYTLKEAATPAADTAAAAPTADTAAAPAAPAVDTAATAPVAAAPAAAAPAAAEPAKLSADAGKTLYAAACAMCHTSGMAGAPKLGDKAAWAPRIAQGDAVLYENAIKGFMGKSGMMPPKGGSSAPDDEVKAAVDYMVAASK